MSGLSGLDGLDIDVEIAEMMSNHHDQMSASGLDLTADWLERRADEARMLREIQMASARLELAILLHDVGGCFA